MPFALALVLACRPPAVAPAPGVTVDVSHPGNAVPDDFLGVSIEWSHVADVLGDRAGHVRPDVVDLMGNFAADGHAPVVRIGGNTEDRVVWDPNGDPVPDGDVAVDASDLSILADLATSGGVTYVLGLNLAADDPAGAAALATAAVAALPKGSIQAFEVGNEPDLYTFEGYRSSYS